MAKKGLGKGLDALFADNDADLSTEALVTLRLNEIEPNRGQPRKQFEEEALSALSESIREHGILQPLVVRPIPGAESYQLVAGERRWRAARMAGLNKVPVIILQLDDAQAMEIALIENLQREDLNPIEEAEGYRKLIEDFGMTQEDVAKKIGKSRPAVANALRLLGLPEEVLELVKKGELSAGHARALLAMDDIQHIRLAARDIVEKGMNVREVEKLASEDKQRMHRPKNSKNRDVLSFEIEHALSERLGRKVRVVKSSNKGIIEMEFYGEDDLKALARTLAGV